MASELERPTAVRSLHVPLSSLIGCEWDFTAHAALSCTRLGLPGIATLVAAAGPHENSALLFDTGFAVRDQLGLAVFLSERHLYERAEAAVAAAIG